MKMQSYSGFCPICEGPTKFSSKSEWFRDDLVCVSCDSIPRERAVAKVLKEVCPKWRLLDIHEAGGVDRGLSRQLRKECKNFVRSHFFFDSSAKEVDGILNVDLENQSHIEDDSFDVFLALDVLEHVFEPHSVLREIHRTLRRNGVALLTFPIQKNKTEAMFQRAIKKHNGDVSYLAPAEYHGNPIDSNGSLVTFDYGYDIHQILSSWAEFEVRIIRFSDHLSGIIGEFTEVVVLKPSYFVPGTR